MDDTPMDNLNRSVINWLFPCESSISDLSPLQSSEVTYEERSHETATQELDLSGSSDAANPKEGPFNNINAQPEPSDIIVDFLKSVIDIVVSPGASATFDLNSRPRQADLLSLLARRFMNFGRQLPGGINLLSMAITYQSQALAIAREESMMEVEECFRTLGDMLYHRWKRLDDISDIDEAVECARQVIILRSRNDQLRAAALKNLGDLLNDRFETLGDLVDIDQAIEYHVLVVQLTSDGDTDKPQYLNSLAHSLWSRHRRTEKVEDIDRAIEYQTLGVQLTPDDHQNKPSLLTDLGNVLKYRHRHYGNLADIDQAIECHTLVIRTQSEDHPDRLAWLMELGCSLQCRYVQTGDLSDLNNAVKFRTMAARLSPTGHPDRPSVLESLGGSLTLLRYQRLGSLHDLNLGIQYQELAAHLSPDSDEATPIRLANLARSLTVRCWRLGDLADVDRAVEYVSQAIQQVSECHPYRVAMISNLAASLEERYRRLGNATDQDLAIEHRSLAAKLTPDGHPHKPGLLCDLGTSLVNRSEGSRNCADIDLAIDYHERAVELTPDDYQVKPRQLAKLAKAYAVRSCFICASRGPSDLVSVLTCCRKAASLPIIDPETQMECAWSWAYYSLKLDQSPLEAYQAAFALLPHFVWLGQTVQARYESVSGIRVLVSAAVAWAISVGSYDVALEWLEQGRSVVWAQQLQTRAPFDDLAAADPQLAERMRNVASQLQSAEPLSGATCLPADSSFDLDIQGQRHGAALQWEQLLQEVRQLSGFEDYMLPRKAHILKKAAISGPVVVNTHETRCDALVIVPDQDDMMHVPLVRLEQNTLCRLRADMVLLIGHRGDEDKPRGFKRDKSSESAQDTLYPLKVLWSDVVEPILNALQHTNRLPQNELPHITWCATGLLSFFPLHAAGRYDATSQNTFDLVVSSYTPTLAALLAPRSSVAMLHAGVLAVGQANTPGKSPLPKTVDELAIVGKYTAATGYHQLDGSMATVDATLDAMEQYSGVHLACHAIQDRMDPQQSAFYLHDGRLTLETITKRAYKHKGLAFLSACQTATGDDTLPDEAMHLAAGMLAAGYPSVIATMWSIADDDGPEVAEVVYGELAKDGKMDRAKVALALHNATRKLRDKMGVEAVCRWAPFIHIGL
ncbi:hypothetical protein FRC12_002817 [Ceratobasidium sp. 428]|nr:hypothetical protein FRC12_002817 [Ceratobasidium sp. 428]